MAARPRGRTHHKTWLHTHAPQIPLDAAKGRRSRMKSAQATSRVLTTESTSPCGAAGYGRLASGSPPRRRSRDRVGAALFQPLRARHPDDRLRRGTGDHEAQVHRRLPLGADAADDVRPADQHAVGTDRGTRGREHRRRELHRRAARLRRFSRTRRPIRTCRGIPGDLSCLLAGPGRS